MKLLSEEALKFDKSSVRSGNTIQPSFVERGTKPCQIVRGAMPSVVSRHSRIDRRAMPSVVSRMPSVMSVHSLLANRGVAALFIHSGERSEPWGVIASGSSGCRSNFFFIINAGVKHPHEGNNSCMYLKRMFETLWMLEKLVFLLAGACLLYFSDGQACAFTKACLQHAEDGKSSEDCSCSNVFDRQML